MRFLAFLGCLAVVLISRPAFAGDSHFYLVPSAGAVLFSGGSQTFALPDSPPTPVASPAHVTADLTRITTSRSTDRQSLRLGYRIMPHLALELEAARTGRWSQMGTYLLAGNTITGQLNAYRSYELGANAVVSLPVGRRFTLQAGLGCAEVHYSIQGGALSGLVWTTGTATTTDAQYSVELGATCRVAPSVALRADVEAFFPQAHLAQPMPHMIGLSLGVVIDL